MRLAEEALATSVINGVPLFLTIKAMKVDRFAQNTTVKTLRYVEKKLTVSYRAVRISAHLQPFDDPYRTNIETPYSLFSWEVYHDLVCRTAWA